ncbi:hypothetical protein H6H01_35635 [Nostoc calcicola FACHB-3891]|nr:hypothetical protein [Nostoc calcicola FACHB-3891]
MKIDLRLLIAIPSALTLPLSVINPEYKDLAAGVAPPAIVYLLKEGDKPDEDK